MWALPDKFMRIFVYLLALLTGFSAAHAASGSVHSAAALENAAAATAEVAPLDAAAEDALAFGVHEYVVPVANNAVSSPQTVSFKFSPRIYRGDRAQE